MDRQWWVCDGDRQIWGPGNEEEAQHEYDIRVGEGYDQLQLIENVEGIDRVREVERD